ncbi:MAG: amidase family protein [Bacilli bacterium]|jgi:aspartyl-tRNA(Asn)/glutamyl-tRNA(Gln) amidotransferase subunit A
MKYLDLTIEELHSLIKEKKITAMDLINESLKRIEKYQEDNNPLITVLKPAGLIQEDSSYLAGIPYVLSDNITTKGILTTGSSDLLKDYIPVFNATVVEKLNKEKALLMGKAILTELGLNIENNENFISGAASSVLLGMVSFALDSDTTGSVRKTAAFRGIVGFKPTYGLVSRFGLMPFSSSLDHIGCFTKKVKDLPYILNAIKGYDEKDSTSLRNDKIDYILQLDDNVKGKKLFYFKEMMEEGDQKVLDNFKMVLKKCKKLGIIVEEVSINKALLKALSPATVIISLAEAASNNANLTGLNFGIRGQGNSIDDLLIDARFKGFTSLTKSKFIIGHYVLQKEKKEKLFLNAQRIRRMIVEKMNELFSSYDALILPSSNGFKKDDDHLLDSHLVIGNLGGYPSVSLPSGNSPFSINITGPIKKDLEVLKLALALENEFNQGGDQDV